MQGRGAGGQWLLGRPRADGGEAALLHIHRGIPALTRPL